MNRTYIYHFEIATNGAGQRILIVGDDYRSFVYESVPFDAFDAIFFETEDEMILKRQLGSITSSRRDPNYTFKAIFMKPTINSKSALAFADGLYWTIEDKLLIRETQRIIDRFRSLGFKLYDRSAPFWTPDNRMFHVVRTYLLRSDNFPEWELCRDSSLGYAIPRLETLLKFKVVSVRDVESFKEKLHTHHKLLTHKELSAVVYCCPQCYESKYVWQELCPKCGTMDIDEVNMIHHFRCANISPEESYLQDGKLVCPKCRLELKHIGVDYDRPSSMNYCPHDNIHFSSPAIKALCTNCHATSDPSELRKLKLYKANYTSMGVATFAQYDHLVDNDDIPKLPSLYSYNNFLHILKIRVSIARANGDLHLALFRLRMTPDDNYDIIESDVTHRVYRSHPNAVITYKNGAFYLLQAFTENKLQTLVEDLLPLKELNRIDPRYTFDGEYIELDVNSDIDSIIASF